MFTFLLFILNKQRLPHNILFCCQSVFKKHASHFLYWWEYKYLQHHRNTLTCIPVCKFHLSWCTPFVLKTAKLNNCLLGLSAAVSNHPYERQIWFLNDWIHLLGLSFSDMSVFLQSHTIVLLQLFIQYVLWVDLKWRLILLWHSYLLWFKQNSPEASLHPELKILMCFRLLSPTLPLTFSKRFKKRSFKSAFGSEHWFSNNFRFLAKGESLLAEIRHFHRDYWVCLTLTDL